MELTRQDGGDLVMQRQQDLFQTCRNRSRLDEPEMIALPPSPSLRTSQVGFTLSLSRPTDRPNLR